MRRRWWMAGLAVLLLMGLLWQGLERKTGSISGERPFRDMEAADIVSASVVLTPPDVTLAVSDLEELAELLQAVVCRERDDTAVLRFIQPPDTVTEVRCWRPEDAPGDAGTPVAVQGDAILLEPGERIYQAEARWDGILGGGTAWYAFAVRCGTE